MYNWLVHGGWPTDNQHSYSEVRDQHTLQRLMNDIERIVDVIITPKNMDVMLGYLWEKLNFTRGNCTFRAANKSKCKVENCFGKCSNSHKIFLFSAKEFRNSVSISCPFPLLNR